MPQQSYHLTSADAGAPALLPNTPGSLIALLDAILVDGYGSHPGAGWVKAFSGTNKAAYRLPPGTSERYMRIVDDNALNSTSYSFAKLDAYGDMTDVDTGTAGFQTSSDSKVMIGNDALVGGIPWAAYCTDRFLYLLIATHSHTATYPYVYPQLLFGDLQPLPGANFTPSTFVGGSAATNGSNPPNPAFSCALNTTSPAAGSASVTPNLSNGESPTDLTFVVFGPNNNGGRVGDLNSVSLTESSKIIVGPADVWGEDQGSSSRHFLTGRLPGLLAPFQKISDGLDFGADVNGDITFAEFDGTYSAQVVSGDTSNDETRYFFKQGLWD